MKLHLKYLVGAIILVVSGTLAATPCPTYTYDQEIIIRKAYEVGEPYSLGWTVAAITVQESFVGGYIIRINPKDGRYGSYGLMHTTLEWVMEYEGIDNSWYAKSTYPALLLSHDGYALTMGLNHLIKNQHRGWREMVKRYNGSGVYVNKIATHLKELQKCYKF